jgi:hypothetical protein
MSRAPVFLSRPDSLNARIFQDLPQGGFLLRNAAVVGELQIEIPARPSGPILFFALPQESRP